MPHFELPEVRWGRTTRYAGRHMAGLLGLKEDVRKCTVCGAELHEFSEPARFSKLVWTCPEWPCEAAFLRRIQESRSRHAFDPDTTNIFAALLG